MVPGAHTQGTNHFLNAGHPKDEGRAEAYEAAWPKDFSDRMQKALAATDPSDSDPSEIGRAVAAIVTAPAGKRPFRTVIDPADDGAKVLYLPSKDGYGPLASFYAEHGFAVIQPSHANSKVEGLPADAPGAPLFWRQRVEEMKLILDGLDAIEAAVPALAGRLDRDRIAAVGYSLGGQTVGMLLGARLTDPRDETAQDVDLIEPRIKAGVLLAAPGLGGGNLTPTAAANYSALNSDFSHLTTRTLVVYGDADASPHLTVRGAGWHADPYHRRPGRRRSPDPVRSRAWPGRDCGLRRQGDG